ncbi:MAG: peptide chain release factor 1 [Planctomycetaceae bacterium]|nr:peptide chain release factor 1 [Planctomycetaceae bacterium]
MKPFVRDSLLRQKARLHELDALLSAPDVVNDLERFRSLSREHADASVIVEVFDRHQQREADLATAQELLAEPDLAEMAQDEVNTALADLQRLDEELQQLLLPKDPDDVRPAFVEIRAGTGGDESALFVGDLARMYTRYADSQGWTSDIVSESPSELGGYKEIVIRMAGRGPGANVYGQLRFESGGHRVQRVPVTETQGRIHTSAATVAVLPEATEFELEIRDEDLKVDTMRAGGPGGQKVNKTESAVRITHIPTGIVVKCQDEKSQHKNRAKAMRVLRGRILEAEQARIAEEKAEHRRTLVGSGDRSDRIRTYNFPQGRVTDHRIGLTLYKIDQIMLGQLDELIDAMLQFDREEKLRGGTAN